MKVFIKHLAIILCIVLVSLMATYIGLAVYYHNAFAYGTWINDVYCTGRSIEEVNDDLAAGFTYDGITVYDKDGNSCEILAQQIDYQYDFTEALEIYRKQQNPWMWIESLYHGDSVELKPVVSYNRKALDDILDRVPFLAVHNSRDDGDLKVSIIKTNQGYELLNERIGVLQPDKARAAIVNAIEESRTEVSLAEEECYADLPLTEQMRETLAMWEKVAAFQQCDIVYAMGDDEVHVDASVVCDWIGLAEDGSFATDAEGNLQLKENAVEEYIDALADEYDTVGISRQFHATRGETVTVEGGTYGNKMDRSAETEYLKEAFLAHRTETHEPAYTQKALVQGKDDIGDTYIEVDMGEQMLYYYVDGEQKIATPVVTGNTSRRMGTPSGVNYVYLKQKNRILRGEGYASHVDFWMPVKGNIGIHDASWRAKYGGTIYQTNGSHGCINTPRDAMVQLYDSVEVGTPVVMFY